jgi:hypothetical protein
MTRHRWTPESLDALRRLYPGHTPQPLTADGPEWALRGKLAAHSFFTQVKPEHEQQMVDFILQQIAEAKSAAVQEPVAWRTFDGEGGYDYRTYDMNESYAKEWNERNPNHKGWVEPLYTTPPAQPAPVALRDALAGALSSVYVCGRVWDAWSVGTMTEDDFQPAAECDEVLDSLVEAVAKATPPAAQPAPVQEPTLPELSDPEDCRAWCPRCDGTRDEVQMSDSSPDAHEVTVNCRHCDGAGTLYAAYTGVVRELAKQHEAYSKACGEIYFSNLAVVAPTEATHTQPANVPEGCTPADAAMLRRANHALAAENDALRAQAEKVAIEYTPGEWFDATTVDLMESFYLSRLPVIREAARAHGYAIGMHGSMRRDMDLIAVPWREGASDADTLAEAIQKAACGITQSKYQWERKPAGRVAISMPICWTHRHGVASDGHIDLSVVAQPVAPLTADDILEPKNGALWRVEWWNESCRMMLPSGMGLYAVHHKNGTLQFTLRRITAPEQKGSTK